MCTSPVLLESFEPSAEISSGKCTKVGGSSDKAL